MSEDWDFKASVDVWDFDDWLAFGIKQGFCGPPVCSTHDGIPTSEEEDLLWEEEDPCDSPVHRGKPQGRRGSEPFAFNLAKYLEQVALSTTVVT